MFPLIKKITHFCIPTVKENSVFQIMEMNQIGNTLLKNIIKVFIIYVVIKYFINNCNQS